MQQITLNRGEAKVLAAAAALGAIEQGQTNADKIDEAEALRRDAIAILQGSGKSPQYVLELAVRITQEASDVTATVYGCDHATYDERGQCVECGATEQIVAGGVE